MTNELSSAFLDWLDEVARTPTGVLIQERGETRICSFEVAFAEWRSRHLTGASQPARPPRFPRVERRKHQLAILGHKLEKFRHREWAPALRAAGVRHRRVYDSRHTFATWAIESGVELLYLARIMGTSVAQIEDTYARWLKRNDDQLRELLHAYDRVASG